MQPTFFKGIVIGAATAVVTLAATAALAGTGIGGVFNLGVDNTVNGQTQLRGNTGGNPQLRVNNQQGSDAAIGVLGIHSAAAGTAPGVQGESASTAAGATGLFGRMTSANAAVGSAAVKGINNGAGMGVYGRNASNLPFAYGVSGEGRYGVTGVALFSGASSGVYGNAPTGFAGVEGHSGNANGFGIYGLNTAGGPGIYGQSTASGTGVRGFGGNGGSFSSSASNGTGVVGTVTGAGHGVRGEAAAGGTGVRGIGGNGGSFSSSASNGTGVVGTVTGAGHGVRGEAGAGGTGVYGKSAGGWAGQFEGDVKVTRYLTLGETAAPPPAQDCDEGGESGRLIMNYPSNGYDRLLWVCRPPWGWRVVDTH